MEKARQYTKKQFIDMELINLFPEEKRDYLTHVLNFLLRWVVNETEHSDNINGIDTYIIPIFLRTLSKIELNDDEILQICNELKGEINQKINDEKEKMNHVNYIDYEAKIMCEYSDKIIEKYKK